MTIVAAVIFVAIVTVVYLFGIKPGIKCKDLFQGDFSNLRYQRGGRQECH